MKCSEVEQRLTAYLDNFLPDEEMGMLEQHCTQCSNCRRSLEYLQKTKGILKGLDEIDPPPWLTEKIMDRIHENKEKKGWFQRFFLPLRVKIPIQALATILVVGLSVYIYKSTSPELGNLDRHSHVPQVAQNIDHSEKSQIDTKKEIKIIGSIQAPGQAETKKKVQPTEKKADKPVQQEAEQPIRQEPKRFAPGQADRTSSGTQSEDFQTPRVNTEKSTAYDHDLKKGSVPKALPPPTPEKTERHKTRGMATREEKRQESGIYPSAAVGALQETSGRITVITDNPSDIIQKAHRIMNSLSATGVREKTENDSIIISGWMDPKSVLDLKNKIAEIALVAEGQTRIKPGGDGPQYIEIVVLKDTRNP